MTFAEFRQQVMEKAFPNGEPENLADLRLVDGEQTWGTEGVLVRTGPHTKDLIAALIWLQEHVRTRAGEYFYQSKHTDIFDACSTYFQCGATVVSAPCGKIQQVRTHPLGRYCCGITYDPLDQYSDFVNWLYAARPKWTDPANEGMDPMPQGFLYPEAASDKGHRWNFGKWCLHNGKLYVGPHLESTESLWVQWEGVKRSWKEADVMDEFLQGDLEIASDSPQFDDGTILINACALYVLGHHLLNYVTDSAAEGQDKLMQWSAQVAEICYRVKNLKRSEPQPRNYEQPRVSGYSLSCTCASPSCAPMTLPGDSVNLDCFAFVSDWGITAEDQRPNILAASQLVQSWNPGYIITGGDNRQGSGYTYAQTFAAAPFYQAMLSEDQNLNRFWAALGNHDSYEGNGLTDWYTQFPMLPGNKRYYTLVRGYVQWFFLTSEQNEESGYTSTSDQAKWLQAQLAVSHAPWKVVVVHRAPYTNHSGNNSQNWMRWPYADWGADLVLSGHTHAYERIVVAGLNYIVGGWGGHGLVPLALNIAGTAVKYNSAYGAIRGTATCNQLQIQAIAVGGTIVDTLTLTK